MQDSSGLDQSSIAIIGMAGRFPGARDIDEFWLNLADGVESIVRLTDAQLLAAGVESAELRDPAYVKAAAVLDDIDLFDASFFGFSAKDAAIMDPQHRVFLECAWHAFEHAGWAIEQFDGKIGVYAGSGMNTYLIYNLLANRKLVSEAGLFVLKQTGNDKDVLGTRVSYQLNLTGPSLTVQTACSTSLVAVHLACQALLNGECDMALAGGVTIEIPHGRGYHYREGEILARDGHCRPFDADSSGTIFGSGVGTVVLRRLDDALRDGDTVHAIIRGTAINNDGSRKVGFLAPSVVGQAEVIAEAMAAAGVDADSISYVEAHGTGTKVGDPIEFEALTRAFRESTDRRGFCAVGSLKANVGHLDAAAGVAGLIKTTLALQHRQFPPTVNFNQPNPLIDFDGSPFFVTNTLREWQTETAVRRAGVTSLGIGGTNAHVILEEAPARGISSPPRNRELLTLSAKTPAALEATARNLADYLEGDTQLDDVAFTSHLGRTALSYRRAIVCGDSREAVSLLRHAGGSKVITRTAAEGESAIVFLFSGQGAQYPGMARALYETDPDFKSVVDYCCEFLKPLLGIDLRSVIFPDSNASADAASLLMQTHITQPALFVIEYALAQLWIRLGIKPAAMLGHSIGEFAAACVAGVFSLDDTLRIVAERGRLMQSLPFGLMIAVAATEAEVKKILNVRCAIASVNAHDQCVVAGPPDAIGEVEVELGRLKLPSQRLQVSHAFHSPMMDSIVEPFAAFVGHFQANQPAVRWVSSATGTWIGAEEAMQPAYWARQLRGTVRFYDGVTTLLKAGTTIFVEAGPGHTLASLVAQHPERPAVLETINTLPGARANVPADASFLHALGILWASGARVDWRRYHRGERRHRVALPGYPFERRRYWVDPDPPAVVAASDAVKPEAASADFGGLFQPVWKEAELSTARGPANGITGPWLIFADTRGLSDRAAAILKDRGEKVTIVRAGETFARRDSSEIQINPANRGDYDELIEAMRAGGVVPRRIVHLWSVLSSILADDELDELEDTMAASFWSILFFAQAFGGEINTEAGCRLAICSNQLLAPEGEQCESPGRALLAGPCGVIPKELPDLQCVHADFVIPADLASSNGNRDHLLGDIALQVITELDGNAGDSPVAYRRRRRFVRTHEPLARHRHPITLRDGAVHLITGGLGGIGLALAEAIAQASKARLVLLGRRALPPRDEWSQLVETGGELVATLRKIEAIERSGAEVMTIAADVSDESSMRVALAAINQRFGGVTGVIHAAGTIADEPLLTKSQSSAAAVLAPKVRGTLVLERILAEQPLDYMILCSSVSSIIVPTGQVDYAAANAFLDAFAQTRSGTAPYPVIALQFPRWSDVGMAADRQAGPNRSPAQTGNDRAKPAEVTSETTLSLANNWIVGEHRMLNGTGLFPGTGYIEMILDAAQELVPGQRITIRDLQFKLPLEVAPGVTRCVRTTLRRDGEDYHFAAAAQIEAGWPECAAARVTLERDRKIAKYDLPDLQRRCVHREMIFAHRQNRVQESFFNFGPRWAALERVGFGQGEALVSVELKAEFHGDLDSYKIHPALLDMATGAGLFLIPNYESLHRAYVPMNYGRITVRRQMPPRVFSHIRIRSGSPEEPVVTFDVDILDEEGDSLIEIREFMMRRIDDGLGLAAQTTPAPAPSLTMNRADLPRDSFVTDDGVAAFRSVLNGAWAANVVAFPSDFVAYARAAQPHRMLQHTLAGSTNGAPMGDDIERNLAQWWRELLGAESLTPQSDFFEMGGQSLTAVRLFAKIKKDYGIQLSAATIYESPTIEKLAARIRNGRLPNAVTKSSLIPIRPSGSRHPLYLFPHMHGTVIGFDTLVRRLPHDLPVYGVESTWLGEADVPLRLEEMAARQLESVRALQPHGPFYFLGYSFGGLMAFEAARQLVAAGETVGMLGMLDTWQAGHIRELDAVHRPSQKLARRARKALVHAKRLWTGPERLGYLEEHFVERYRRKLSLAIFGLLVRYMNGHIPQFLRNPSQINMFAAERYIAQSYRGRITMFRAAQGIANDDPRYDDSLGWRNLAENGVEVHEVPGTHRDILKEPNVQVLARKISHACMNSDSISETLFVNVNP